MHPLGSLSFLRHHGKLRPEMPVTTDSGFPWKSPTTEFTNPTGEHPLATARRIGNRQVFLAGWRPHEQLPQALNAADALVLPSVAEAFGLVLVEAMACALPVIACRTHGPAVLVADGKTGWLIPPDDEDALVDTLVTVANSDQERRVRGRRAQRDSRRYGWAVIAPRFASLYEELLASSPSRQVARGRRA